MATSRSLRRLPQFARQISTRQPTSGSLAFAFDIDGVLVRGPERIPGTQRALNILRGDNPLGIQVPFILLTNGGGDMESAKSAKLSSQLGVHIHESQVIQSHTILRQLAHQYADKPVLVLGGKHDMGRQIMNSYGFRDVYIPLDIFAWNPSIWPLGAEFVSNADLAFARNAEFSRTPISAIFVIHDPRPSWFLEIQVLVDVLRNQYCDAPQPPPELVFCNPDLVWRGQFHRVRLGQGAFRDAFQAVYRSLEGTDYPYTQFGKPTKATYDFAQHALSQIGRADNCYMIGDNPASDIAGANAAGWPSVLVHTGVYDRTHGPPAHVPTHFAEDVLSAVKWAFEREFGVQL